MHRFCDALTHWFIDSLVFDLLVQWLIFWFIGSLIRWFTTSLIHWFVGSLIHCFVASLVQWFFIHWFIHSSTHYFTHSLIHSFIASVHCFFASLVHWFLDSLIDWFIVWFIASFLHRFTDLSTRSLALDLSIHWFIDSSSQLCMNSFMSFHPDLNNHWLSGSFSHNFNTALLLHLKNFPIGHLLPIYSCFNFETSAPARAGHYLIWKMCRLIGNLKRIQMKHLLNVAISMMQAMGFAQGKELNSTLSCRHSMCCVKLSFAACTQSPRIHHWPGPVPACFAWEGPLKTVKPNPDSASCLRHKMLSTYLNTKSIYHQKY